MGERAAIRALTVLQPWASLIARGPKRIENRSWEPPRALLGAYLAIHAGKRCDRDQWEGALDAAANAGVLDAIPLLREADDVFASGGFTAAAAARRRAFAARAVPYGAVLAVARLVGTVRASTDPWFCGPVGWQLADVVALPEPVPCAGAQGVWELPPDVLARVRVGWKEVRGG